MSDTATDYHRSGAQLDAHLRECPQCTTGAACPTGDDTAEREFRAFRAWERDDAQAANHYRRRGLTW